MDSLLVGSLVVSIKNVSFRNSFGAQENRLSAPSPWFSRAKRIPKTPASRQRYGENIRLCRVDVFSYMQI